jgi:hypothetical protein
MNAQFSSKHTIPNYISHTTDRTLTKIVSNRFSCFVCHVMLLRFFTYFMWRHKATAQDSAGYNKLLILDSTSMTKSMFKFSRPH